MAARDPAEFEELLVVELAQLARRIESHGPGEASRPQLAVEQDQQARDQDELGTLGPPVAIFLLGGGFFGGGGGVSLLVLGSTPSPNLSPIPTPFANASGNVELTPLWDPGLFITQDGTQAHLVAVSTGKLGLPRGSMTSVPLGPVAGYDEAWCDRPYFMPDTATQLGNVQVGLGAVGTQLVTLGLSALVTGTVFTLTTNSLPLGAPQANPASLATPFLGNATTPVLPAVVQAFGDSGGTSANHALAVGPVLVPLPTVAGFDEPAVVLPIPATPPGVPLPATVSTFGARRPVFTLGFASGLQDPRFAVPSLTAGGGQQLSFFQLASPTPVVTFSSPQPFRSEVAVF